jgi:predicted NAD/FAD-binding protein
VVVMISGSSSSGGRSAAVVGAGVAGLTAAYLLARRYDVTLYEAEDRLGGHVHTHRVPTRGGATLPIDSGFIVHNDRTYPLLRRLFGELGVEARPTEMSMSIRCEGCGLEYAGGRGLGGVFAQRRRAGDPRFLGLLAQVRRFHRAASRYLATAPPDDLTTLGSFLRAERLSGRFTSHYALPLVACVWSSGQERALDYPARYLFAFLEHHGMLQVKGSPQWYTVRGGSSTYVERIAAALPDVRTAAPVTAVTRAAGHAEVRDADGGARRFDRLVIATHADQALALLADPTPAERDVLGSFGYAANHTVLHTDGSILPATRGARASWNYLMPACTDRSGSTLVSYSMNHLQGHRGDGDYVVTLNGGDRLDPRSVIAEMHYEHPVYTPAAVAAQRRLPELNTGVTAFAGAYHGWGFHEDGCRSGVSAAAALGAPW